MISHRIVSHRRYSVLLSHSSLIPPVRRPRDVASGRVVLLGVAAGVRRIGLGLGLGLMLVGRAAAAATTGHVPLHGRGELALLPDLGAVQVEDDGDGDEHGRHAAQQRRRPLDPHPVEHVAREQREARAAEGPQERVSGDSGSGATGVETVRLAS